MITRGSAGISFAPQIAVAGDLESELLMAVRRLALARTSPDEITMDEIDAFVRASPAAYPRLASPMVSHLIARLVDGLVSDGMLERTGTGVHVPPNVLYAVPPEPRYLVTPLESAGAENDGESAKQISLERCGIALVFAGEQLGTRPASAADSQADAVPGGRAGRPPGGN